ncbi:MAG: hypothetical protein U0835_08760 [Isosphaeraceae bacterium]
MAAGQSTSLLDAASASALSGTIRDTVTNNPNPAILTAPVAPAAGSLGANKSIVIDAIAPTDRISPPPPTAATATAR